MESDNPSTVLVDLAHSYETIPTSEINDILQDGLEHADDWISICFFDNPVKQFYVNNKDWSKDLALFGRCFMSWEVGFETDHGFAACIHATKANLFWQDWFKSRGTNVGRDIFFQTVRDSAENPTWAEIEENRDAILYDAYDSLSSEAFITEQLVIAESGEYLPIQLLLLFLNELDNKDGKPTFQHVYNSFVKHTPKPLSGALEWDIDFFADFIVLWTGSGGVGNGVYHDQVSNRASTAQDGAVEKTSPTTIVTESQSTNSTTYTTYGIDVAAWINWGGPGDTLSTGMEPNNIVKESHSSSGCFTASTEILVDDVQVFPLQIGKLSENYVIVSSGGARSLVSDERVFEPNDDTRIVLYSFNDEEPFFTGTHPFWTEYGWKSLLPLSSSAESAILNVSDLCVGDRVYRIKHTKKIEYELVEIRKINKKVASLGTPIFGIHVREGPRNYHANGYLVAVTYPEMSGIRLIDNTRNHMDYLERMMLCTKLYKFRQIFAKLLGEDTVQTLEREMHASNPESILPQLPTTIYSDGEMRREIRTQTNTHIVTGEENVRIWVNLALDVLIPAGSNIASLPLDYTIPGQLHVSNGKVIVTGYACAESFVKERLVTWARPVSKDLVENGSIKLHSHGCLGMGKISLTEQSTNESLLAYSITVNLRERETSSRDRVALSFACQAFPTA